VQNLEAKLDADKSWANFKSRFLQAQTALRLQHQTTQQAGFHANATLKDTRYQDQAEALANFATAVASDRHSFATLVTSNSDLARQLTDALSEIRLLKTQLTQPPPRHPGTHPPAVPPGNTVTCPRTKNTSYCWSHGYAVSCHQNSENCRRPNPGHQCTTTFHNTMSGSKVEKPTQ
jgi:hypothetical protein